MGIVKSVRELHPSAKHASNQVSAERQQECSCEKCHFSRDTGLINLRYVCERENCSEGRRARREKDREACSKDVSLAEAAFCALFTSFSFSRCESVYSAGPIFSWRAFDPAATMPNTKQVAARATFLILLAQQRRWGGAQFESGSNVFRDFIYLRASPRVYLRWSNFFTWSTYGIRTDRAVFPLEMRPALIIKMLGFT